METFKDYNFIILFPPFSRALMFGEPVKKKKSKAKNKKKEREVRIAQKLEPTTDVSHEFTLRNDR